MNMKHTAGHCFTKDVLIFVKMTDKKGFLLTSQFSKPIRLFTITKKDRLTPKPLAIIVNETNPPKSNEKS